MLAPSYTTPPTPSISISSLVCDTCQQCYIDKATLKSHQQSRGHGNSYSCRFCDRDFNDCYGLYQHLVSKRHGTSPWDIVSFYCDACGTTYPTYGDLEGHCRAVHQHVAAGMD